MLRPLLLGHRGARNYAPENTIEAFDLALAHGCDGFEFDVRRTADGRSVICHDARLGPIEIAGERFDDIVRRYQEECAPAIVLAQRGKLAPGVLSLEEVLGAFGERAFLDIELKVPGLEETTLAALRRYGVKRYVISSFLPEVLARVRHLDSYAVLGFICDKRETLATWREQPVQVVIPERRLVTRELVEEVHTRSRKIYVWTANRESEMRQLAEWGVDGICSDDTKLLASVFEKGH